MEPTVTWRRTLRRWVVVGGLVAALPVCSGCLEAISAIGTTAAAASNFYQYSNTGPTDSPWRMRNNHEGSWEHNPNFVQPATSGASAPAASTSLSPAGWNGR